MKKVLCISMIAFLLFNSNQVDISKIRASEYIPGGIENITNLDGSKVYRADGVDLGTDLSSNFATIRYWDNSFAYSDMYYLYEYYNKELFALISTTHPSASIGSVCVTSGLMGTLKGFEVLRGYEDSAYPLYGNQIGRNIGTSNNFVEYWPNSSNITLSGSFYKNDSRYPLAILSDNNFKISYVYNETMSLAYYVDKNGAAYQEIANGLEEYLEEVKSSENYRYRLINTDNCYYNVQNVGYEESFKMIREAILNNVPVLIGDDDFGFVSDPYDPINPGGHVMVAVATGRTKLFDHSTNAWVYVDEVIYDQGGGRYAAMPIDDVYDYFIFDIRLQKKKNMDCLIFSQDGLIYKEK